jgi:hypothetical protein
MKLVKLKYQNFSLRDLAKWALTLYGVSTSELYLTSQVVRTC